MTINFKEFFKITNNNNNNTVVSKCWHKTYWKKRALKVDLM